MLARRPRSTASSRRAAACLVGLAAALSAAAPATAQIEPPLATLPTADDPTFGPRIEIEAVRVVGNRVTVARVIERALPLVPGDVLRAGDRRLREAETKVLALGFFREVDVSLRRGSSHGRVIVVVRVVERGTITINRLYLGASEAVPWWAGLDLSDANIAGSGIELGAAAVYAARSNIAGGDRQWAGQLRLGAPGVGGSSLGVRSALTHIEASEPYRIAGDDDDGHVALFDALPYRRTGARLGVGADITPLSQLSLDLRLERVHAFLPDAPVRTQADGTTRGITLALRDGTSWISTFTVGFDRDTRPDPVLPFMGDRLAISGQLGASWLGGDYDFATALIRYERWFPVAGVQHVISGHATGGVVLGDAPRFDRFYVGDLDRLLPPRALGLVVSTLPPLDLLGNAADANTYGEVAALLELEYGYRLFRSRGPIYGGDLFVALGAFALARSADLGARDVSLWRALPVDLVADVGLRLDTEVGIFELSIANGLGRIPL